MQLDGKVALVTGASSGIGLAAARKLAEAGARVALVARTRARLDEAVEAIGPRAVAFPFDVSDLENLPDLPAAVAQHFSGLDILVNNAGCNHRGELMDVTAEQAAEVITTNLTAPIVLTRAAGDYLRPGGAIVNVASLAGMMPVHHESSYSASKAGLRAFTFVIAEEFARRDIRVSLVSPGPVDTNFFGDLSTVPDLVFSQPMSSADQVADAILRAIAEGTPEIALPALSGKLATLGYLFPKVARAVRPMLEKRGATNKRRYIERKSR